jgi:hypothetical protein
MRISSQFLCAASLLLAPYHVSCTLVTGAGDYEVDPVREQQEIDKVAMSKVRDLDYTMFKMSDFHAGLPLDVAVVDQDNVMQARARIMLAPQPVGENVVETVHLDNALIAGPQQLFFYVDSQQNYEVDGTAAQIIDHIWIKPVNADGSGEFTHSTMFQFFTEEAFRRLNGSLILKFPGQAALTEVQRRCLEMEIKDSFSSTFEVKIYLAQEDRQVGLFKTYKGGTLPSDNQIELVGILDAGNMYLIQTVLDGTIRREVKADAPQPQNDADPGNLVIEPKDWLPGSFDLVRCLKL